jgi:hypothetical protein
MSSKQLLQIGGKGGKRLNLERSLTPRKLRHLLIVSPGDGAAAVRARAQNESEGVISRHARLMGRPVISLLTLRCGPLHRIKKTGIKSVRM